MSTSSSFKSTWALPMLCMALSSTLHLARGDAAKFIISKGMERKCLATVGRVTEYLAIGSNGAAKLSTTKTPRKFILRTDKSSAETRYRADSVISTWDGSKRLYLGIKGTCTTPKVVFSTSPFHWTVTLSGVFDYYRDGTDDYYGNFYYMTTQLPNCPKKVLTVSSSCSNTDLQLRTIEPTSTSLSPTRSLQWKLAPADNVAPIIKSIKLIDPNVLDGFLIFNSSAIVPAPYAYHLSGTQNIVKPLLGTALEVNPDILQMATPCQDVSVRIAGIRQGAYISSRTPYSKPYVIKATC